MEYLQYACAIITGLILGMVTGVYFVHIYKGPGSPTSKFTKFTGVLATMGGIPNSIFFFLIKEAFIFCLAAYLVFVLIPVALYYYETIKTTYTPSNPDDFERM